MSYLKFVDNPSESGKTVISQVNNLNGEPLGVISWYGPWRRYCFFPRNDCIFDYACLTEINLKINRLKLVRSVVV